MMKTEGDAMLSIPASMVAFPPGSTSNTRCYPPGLGLCLAYYGGNGRFRAPDNTPPNDHHKSSGNPEIYLEVSVQASCCFYLDPIGAGNLRGAIVSAACMEMAPRDRQTHMQGVRRARCAI